MKIFFATDIHGSNICFKKLLNAKKFYGVDIVILGGDMTGKMVVPIVKLNNGSYLSEILNQAYTLKSKDELGKFKENISNMGLYPYVTDNDELQVLQQDRGKADAIFKNLILERFTEWVELADKKLADEKMNLFVCPGNDDDYYIDEILNQSSSIINLENRVYDISPGYQILSTGHSNPTPWHTPREISDDLLGNILENLAQEADQTKTAIYNIHVPPFNSKIDECAELDNELQVKTSLGQVKKKPVGSLAVRRAIEQYQPTLGLFGHVHEGKGVFNISGTLCINPGSNYQEGVLNGCIVNLGQHLITGYQFVTG